MASDLQPDEDGQPQPGPHAAYLRVVAGDDPAGLQRLDAAQAGRRGHRDRVGEVDVGHPAVLLQLGHDGSIYLVWRVLWHEIEHIACCAQ
jgi:hypothetical protein